MPVSTRHSQSLHHAKLAEKLHEAIRRKRVTVREVKVRKPVELHYKAEDECAICLQTLTKKNIAVTPCGHSFCFSCIAENLNISKTCPMCRDRIAPEAKKKTITDEEFESIIYQNFDDASSILETSMVEDLQSESSSSPLLEELEGFGTGLQSDIMDRIEFPVPQEQDQEQEDVDSDSDCDLTSDTNISDDIGEEQLQNLVEDFTSEHLSCGDQDKKAMFTKMLSFAMYVAGDIIDFYEK